jgi:hypothetical protein
LEIKLKTSPKIILLEETLPKLLFLSESKLKEFPDIGLIPLMSEPNQLVEPGLLSQNLSKVS